MFATGCITVLVGLIEFFSLGMGKIYEAWANRHDGKYCFEFKLKSIKVAGR